MATPVLGSMTDQAYGANCVITASTISLMLDEGVKGNLHEAVVDLGPHGWYLGLPLNYCSGEVLVTMGCLDGEHWFS